MTELDPVLRRMKANAAVRLRQEADDLRAEAANKVAMAEVIEKTWALPTQALGRPDLRTFSAQTGRWEEPRRVRSCMWAIAGECGPEGCVGCTHGGPELREIPPA